MTRVTTTFGRFRDEVACWLVLLALNGIATPWYQRMIADALAADPNQR